MLFFKASRFLAACATIILASCSAGGLTTAQSSSSSPQPLGNPRQSYKYDSRTSVFAGRPIGMLRAHAAAPLKGLSPAAKRQSLIYVSDYVQNAIIIYPANKNNPAPVGMITDGIDGPEGVAIDRHGTLYVANNTGNTVTEYPAGAASPSVTLSTSIVNPVAVSVAHNVVSVADTDSSTVLEFKKGSTSPDVTITSITGPGGIGNDASGNLYVAWNNPPFGTGC
jgi:hypothetical protein